MGCLPLLGPDQDIRYIHSRSPFSFDSISEGWRDSGTGGQSSSADPTFPGPPPHTQTTCYPSPAAIAPTPSRATSPTHSSPSSTDSSSTTSNPQSPPQPRPPQPPRPLHHPHSNPRLRQQCTNTPNPASPPWSASSRYALPPPSLPLQPLKHTPQSPQIKPHPFSQTVIASLLPISSILSSIS